MSISRKLIFTGATVWMLSPLAVSAQVASCPEFPVYECRKTDDGAVSFDTLPANGVLPFSWTWRNGDATTLAEFGDPATTGYAFCAYAVSARGKCKAQKTDGCHQSEDRHGGLLTQKSVMTES